MLLLLLLQSTAILPTIQLNVHVEAREVIVERSGEATLTVRAEPDAGSSVEIDKRPDAKGARVIRNFVLDLDAHAMVADPQAPLASPPQPQDREAPQPDDG